jgi:hypothetical protein
VEDTLLLKMILSAVWKPSYPAAYVMASVPAPVIGEPDTDNPVGTV